MQVPRMSSIILLFNRVAFPVASDGTRPARAEDRRKCKRLLARLLVGQALPVLAGRSVETRRDF